MLRATALLLALCGCPAPAHTARYGRAETVQFTWALISERGVRLDKFLPWFHQPSGRQWAETHEVVRAPNKVVAMIRSLPPTPSQVPFDLRLVGLFTRAGGVDTLVVDKGGNAQFGDKRFRLTPRLAILLRVHSSLLNPRFYYQQSFYQRDKRLERKANSE